MDFGALPPEVNSGRMYSGPGSGPLLAAASAWGGLAAELSSTASSYDSVVSGLTSEAWTGPSSAAMTAAAVPYAAWMSSTAAQAEQAAAQARVAAAAYDAAFAAMVPPPAIAANRSLLMSLIATNFLGQNTAAIAAAEAHYAEMWAQDATAMYGYAATSAGATKLTQFTAPPSTTNPGAAAAQVAAGAGTQAHTTLSQLVSMVPPALQSLGSSGPSAAQATGPLFTVLDFLAGPLSPISLFGIGGIPYLLAIQCVLLPMNGSNVVAALARADKMTAAGQWPPNPFDPAVLGSGEPVAGPRLAGLPGPVVSAGTANSAPVGRLSVPQAWTAAASAAESSARALPAAGPATAATVVADSPNGMASNAALGGLAGRAMGATGGAASRAAGEATGKKLGSKKTKPSKATIIVIPPSARD